VPERVKLEAIPGPVMSDRHVAYVEPGEHGKQQSPKSAIPSERGQSAHGAADIWSINVEEPIVPL
jgi:hypothetical protein